VNDPDILNNVMQSDLYRLRRQWQRLRLQTADDPDNPTLKSWLQSAEHSAQLYQKRQRSIPGLSYDPELPITAHREEIVQLLRERQTIIVCGETGSGKSTQLPKLCLEAGLGCSGIIGHTQPRRLAARAVSSRLAEELGTQVGGLVGFKIRFTDATSTSTLVKVMTDGVLLAETQSDRFLEQYDALIIDEAHERSLNIDFLLGYLRRLLSKRADLRLIITSATIDPERFAQHFADSSGPAPILEVSGRTYPVEMRYRALEDLDGNEDRDETIRLQAIAAAVDELFAEGPGDILIFFPTERDIRLASKHLRGHLAQRGIAGSTEILPLYARLSQAEQNRIFAPHSGRRLVLSTNVAESSLTVPGIRYVIDTGLVRMSRYASRSKVQRLPIEPVSQASANQRSGRCGRIGPGVCIRLFDEADFVSRPKFTTPEIRRSDLANVLLQSLLLRLGPIDEFPLLDAPNPESIRDAQRTLKELGAIDDRMGLTPIGRQLGKLPCDVRVGRMLLEAHQRRCLAEVTIIAAGLEVQDVRQRPAGLSAQADAAHSRFQDPHSDFLSLIRLWDFYENLQSQLGRSRLQKALQQNFLSHHGFREWSDIIRQLRELLIAAGLKPEPRRLNLPPVPIADKEEPEPGGSNGRSGKRETLKEEGIPQIPKPEGYAAIHQSLLAGLLSGVAHRDQRFDYKACGGLSVRLWPGSGLFRRSPKWIMAAEIVETRHRYARTAAELDVQWIESAASELLKHSYSQPHWSEKTGAAMVHQKSTLYGLTVVAGRRVPLSPIDPAAAREMMIEHGLVEGRWRCDLPFYRHNLEMIADMDELVRRTRSRRYIVDRYHLMNFYSVRIPESVVDLHGLKQWISDRSASNDQLVRMRPEDLMATEEENLDVAEDFPNAFRIGPAEFPLEYHFEPGHERDGVTIHIPKSALRQASQEALEWLVPGLLDEKILAIIKALPKALRTWFVPAPDVARKLSNQLRSVDRQTPFSLILAETLSKHAGHKVSPDLLTSLNLPDHLRFRIQVIDDDGGPIEASRDINELIIRYVPKEKSEGIQGAGLTEDLIEQTIREPEQLDQIPKQTYLIRGGVKVAAFGAVADAGKVAVARLVDTPDEAQRLSRIGLIRLFSLKNGRLLRSQVSHLPQWNQSAMMLSSMISSATLQQGLQDLIARIAFIEDRPLPISSADFTARQARAHGQISMATQAIAPWLPKLAGNYHSLRLALDKAPDSWREVTNDIQRQIEHLFHDGFLVATPWKWLSEYPRYLQAAILRLGKLTSGGLPRDRNLSQPISALLDQLDEAKLSPRCLSLDFETRLNEIGWAIEEYRVSQFAQQLGTRLPVSAKRISEMFNQLESR
jgi:ATP-dependent helicase HrpA